MTQQQPSTQTPQAPQTPDMPPLTRGQKISYSIGALVIIGGIVALFAWSAMEDKQDTDKNSDLKANGLRVTGTATGDAHSFTDRNRRSSSTNYKVIYEYSYPNEDRDGRIDTSTAIGQKVFNNEEDVQALEGETADVYYDPNDPGKGTYVENEPEQ